MCCDESSDNVKLVEDPWEKMLKAQQLHNTVRYDRLQFVVKLCIDCLYRSKIRHFSIL